jgi:sphinganine C4-monooxygenase
MTTSFMNISAHNLGQFESCILFRDTPFYYSDRPSLLSGISDHHLALASPVIAYWGLSLFFHALDVSGWRWLDKYRIHESYEVRSRNRVSQTTVVWAVVLQHLIQTTIGLYWLSEDPRSTGVHHRENMENMAQTLTASASWVFGTQAQNWAVELRCSSAMYYLYWWGIPIIQFFFAM